MFVMKNKMLKPVVIAIALVLVPLFIANAQNNHINGKSPVIRSLLTFKIDNNEPVGEINLPLKLSVKKSTSVYYYVELTGMEGHSVHHEWLLDGILITRKKVNISNNNWHTSSRQLFVYNDKTNWTARLVDETGRVLNEIEFNVVYVAEGTKVASTEEWTKVESSKNGAITFYADFTTIGKKENKVKMWVLLDYKTVNKLTQGEQYLSATAQNEYDCEEETTRMLDINLYSGNMVTGEAVQSYSNIKDESESISPGSIDESLFKIACGITGNAGAGHQGAFHIGDNGPAGGKVFYVSDAGLHGLEAAPADQSSGAVWGCLGTTISGANSSARGAGAANTAAIVAGCAEANTSAKIADAYALNGYTDWYLPSQDELNLLYQQKTVVGGFANSNYWSATESGSNVAWGQYFNSGYQLNLHKGLTLPVRAVRAF